MDFELNPYDPCVTNKMINGKQYTIAWYVDDNLLSHHKQKVVDDIIGKIEEHFPGLMVNRGDEHVFIRMKLKFREDGTLEINLEDYTEECIETFHEELGSTVSSPAEKWIFDVNDKARKLTEEKADIFHSVVAKLLWVLQ